MTKAKPKYKRRPQFYQCGGCEQWHPKGFVGDCRQDEARFSASALDKRYPDRNHDGWPDWIEVDE